MDISVHKSIYHLLMLKSVVSFLCTNYFLRFNKIVKVSHFNNSGLITLVQSNLFHLWIVLTNPRCMSNSRWGCHSEFITCERLILLELLQITNEVWTVKNFQFCGFGCFVSDFSFSGPRFLGYLIIRVNSVGNINFGHRAYNWNMLSLSCVECPKEFFEKKFLKKKLWFSPKIEFLSEKCRFLSFLQSPPFPDLSRIEA